MKPNNMFLQVHLAQHDYPIAGSMYISLLNGYSDFSDDFLSSCEMSQDLAKVPLQINNDPKFDSKHLPGILDYLTPGIWIILLFFLGNVLSGDFFIEEILVCISTSYINWFDSFFNL